MLRTDTNRDLFAEPAVFAPLTGYTLVRAGTHTISTHTGPSCPVAAARTDVVNVAALACLPEPSTVAGCPLCETNEAVTKVGAVFAQVRAKLAHAEDWFSDSVGSDDGDISGFRVAVDPDWRFAGRSLHDDLAGDLARILPDGSEVGAVEAAAWCAAVSGFVTDRCRALVAAHPDLDPAGIYEDEDDAPVQLVVISADLATNERAGVFRYTPLLTHDRERPGPAVFALPDGRVEQAQALTKTNHWYDGWLVRLDRPTFDALDAHRQWPGLLATMTRAEPGTPADVRQDLFDAAVAAALT